MAERILVVEDDGDIREEIVDLLREAGYEVLVARNGSEALDLLRQGELPCVIVLDLMMPVMDGWSFRTEQMNDPTISHIPVVVASGAHDAATAAKTLAAADYLVKPFKTERLLAMVQAHC